MDRKTFSDPRVMKKSEQLTMVKVDCTTPNRTVQDFMNRFHVTGMPTLLFLDRAGKGIDSLRAIGFVDAETFLRHIETALTGK